MRHQTLIVAIGFALTGIGLSVGTEAMLVVAGTVLGCLTGYEIVRRVPALRLVFGLKRMRERPRQHGAADALSRVA
ncbi:MAG: hypothetical protein AB7I79_00815 [Rhizobiaceae bacterium]